MERLLDAAVSLLGFYPVLYPVVTLIWEHLGTITDSLHAPTQHPYPRKERVR